SDLLDEGSIAGSVRLVAPEHRVEGREDRGERVPPQRFEVRRRRVGAMSGDADRPGEPLVEGTGRRLEGAARTRCEVELARVADRMKLQQVDVVGPQP